MASKLAFLNNKKSKIASIFFSVLVFSILVYINRLFFHDDAYITLRYVRNFITGNGIVWNPGEFVQGYSNFFQLMLISFLGELGINLVVAARVIGFAALGALFLLMLHFGLNFSKNGEKPLWHLPSILVITSIPLISWSLGGLEGTLYSFIIAIGTYFYMLAYRKEKDILLLLSGISFGFGFLTRPDGAIFIIISAGYLFLMMLYFREYKKFLLRMAILLASALLIILPYIFWQYSYYGDIVPNTFYAKAGSFSLFALVSGIKYTIKFFLHPPFLPALFIASIIFLSWKKLWNPILIYLALMIIGYGTFVIYVGGDHMPAYRFFLPVIPLLIYYINLVLTDIVVEQRLKRFNTANITAVFLVFVTLSIFDYRINPMKEDAASRVGKVVGKYIRNEWPEGSTIALSTAGSTPFYAHNNEYIDMLGLNDPHIAKRKIEKIELEWQKMPGHLKGDGRYVLQREPDYIILGPAEGRVKENPLFLSDLELSRIEEFNKTYKEYKVKIPITEKNSFYVHKGVKSDTLYFTYYERIPGDNIKFTSEQQ